MIPGLRAIDNSRAILLQCVEYRHQNYLCQQNRCAAEGASLSALLMMAERRDLVSDYGLHITFFASCFIV
jgi:hypothetical protein